MRLLILFPNFGPYHFARLQAAHECGCWERVAGLEIAAQEELYPWHTDRSKLQVELHTLFRRSLEEVSSGERVAATQKFLDEWAPDVVAICGYERSEMRAALGWCKQNGKTAILMSESKRDDAPRAWWREAIKRRLISRFDGALVGGRAHADYAAQLGIARSRIALGYDVVDNEAFWFQAENERATPTRNPRSRPYFLAVNRFVARKNLRRLIEAFALYRRALEHEVEPALEPAESWELVLIGDGEERADLEAAAREFGCEHDVVFTGFLQQEEIARYMAFAGAFVHPAEAEQWGLVVNEAAACGLPLLISRVVGSAPELLEDGVNGWSFDPADARDIAATLQRVALAPEAQIEAMSSASRQIVARWAPDRFAQGLWKAAHGDSAEALASKSSNLVQEEALR